MSAELLPTTVHADEEMLSFADRTLSCAYRTKRDIEDLKHKLHPEAQGISPKDRTEWEAQLGELDRALQYHYALLGQKVIENLPTPIPPAQITQKT